MTSFRDPDYATLLPEAAAVEPPCLSLYQPTHRHYPDTQQNPIRFKNLVSVLETSLREKYANKDARALRRTMPRLAEHVLVARRAQRHGKFAGGMIHPYSAGTIFIGTAADVAWASRDRATQTRSRARSSSRSTGLAI